MGPILFISFLISVFSFSLHRCLFLVWNWDIYQHFPRADLAQAFLHGIRFDVSALSMLYVIPSLFLLISAAFQLPDRVLRRVGFVLILLFVLPAALLNVTDAEMIHFLGRRWTWDALFLLRETTGKTWDIFSTYWGLFAGSTVLIFAWGIVQFGIFQRDERPPSKSAVRVGSIILAVFGLFLGIRGGLQSKPLGFAHAQVFNQPILNTLLLNSPFSVLTSSQRATLPKYQFFATAEEMNQHLDQQEADALIFQLPSELQNSNVMVIILESFNYEYQGHPFGDAGYTPFLDSLAVQGLAFKEVYANGRRSIEGIASILAGVPALMNEPFISSQYLTNQFLGVGTELGRQSYSSAFFHGAKNGSMYFDSFVQAAGVQKYYGLNEFPDPTQHDGTWGIWDEPFFLWTAEQVSQMPKPFFVSLFSLTSHNPFRVPAAFHDRFKAGTLDIHRSIQYTDWSLQQFFKKAEKQDWYKNTLFVFTADHTYKPSRPEFENLLGRYRVPLIFFHPQVTKWPKIEARIAQHIDLLPSLFDLLGKKTSVKSRLGKSVFREGLRSAIFFADEKYHLITPDRVLTTRDGQSFQAFEKSDARFEQPSGVKASDPDAQRLRSQMQYFSLGLWNNKFYTGSERP
ncbi:MAG: LTA synthase family protein [Proteobacteria bacterium]|nr:LTA synthase family protein [Pseudomonadota bacterium]